MFQGRLGGGWSGRKSQNSTKENQWNSTKQWFGSYESFSCGRLLGFNFQGAGTAVDDLAQNSPLCGA